jgi:thymidylate synthase (methanogen type)
MLNTNKGMIMPKFQCPGDAWQYAISEIERAGSQIITEDNALIREVLNLRLEVLNPLHGYPIKGSNWDLPALEVYAADLCNFSYDCKGFDYTYNERMGRQIHYITKMLKKYPTTRRATAYLWLPEKDLETPYHKPCQIVASYLLRDDKLYATHFFRSHDIRDAWPANVYGLGSLQRQIADEIEVCTGSLSTFSASAHYYIR